MSRRVLVVCLLLLGAVACEESSAPRYETFTSQNSEVFRFDTETGQLAVRYGKALFLLEEKSPAVENEVSAAEAESLRGPRTYRALRLEELGDVTVSLSTMWLDSHVYTRIELKPLTPQLEQAWRETKGHQAFLVNLSTGEGFTLHSDRYPLDRFVPLIDGEGDVAGLQQGFEHRLSAELYQELGDWSIAWRQSP